MSKLYKIIIILAITGIILCGIGFVGGGYLGMYMDKTGWHPYTRQGQVASQTFDDVKKIDVKGKDGRIEVIEGERFEVLTRYYSNAPEITFNNGILTVRSARNTTWLNIGFNFRSEKITVKIPENADLERLNIENDNGSIYISNKMFAKNFSVYNDNGSIEIEDITSENAVIQNKNGSIALTDFASVIGDVSNKNGSIKLFNFATVEGKISNQNGSITGDDIKGKNQFINENGSIKLSAFNLADFYIQTYTENGTCRLNGDKIKRPIGDIDSTNQIIAENQNGSVKIFDK